MASMDEVVVVAGMLFARFAAILGATPLIYYRAPALTTLLLPPVAFRMRRREAVEYLLLAFGWHEYLPFWFAPSLNDRLQSAA